MEILKNQGESLAHVQTEANKVKVQTMNAPETKADIFPESKKKRRDCTLSSEMVTMLVKQLGSELSNYHLYRTFAAYFHRNDLPKLGEYYEGRADEENVHHDWIYNYLVECDAEFSYPRVEAINIDITDHIFPFRTTVDREIETTLGINQIVNLAAEEGDWATFTMLTGDDPKTGKLCIEQRNFISLAA